MANLELICSEFVVEMHGNLRRLHRSKNNNRKFIVIGQIIGSGLIYSKPMNNRFLDQKSTKTINNRNIIGLNRMGRLKH